MGQGKGGGGPKFDMSPKVLGQIERLAGYGLSQTQIAHVIGCHPDTLGNRKKEPEVLQALSKGQARAQANVGKALYEKAKGGDVAAIKWYETTRAGRSEKTEVLTRKSHEEALDELDG